VQWIRDEFAVSISTQALSRELRTMGYRKLTARPRHHAQDVDAIPAFNSDATGATAVRGRNPLRRSTRKPAKPNLAGSESPVNRAG